jgi:hypothetical protein
MRTVIPKPLTALKVESPLNSEKIAMWRGAVPYTFHSVLCRYWVMAEISLSVRNWCSCSHYPTYIRGEAYLAAGQGTYAAGEFQKLAPQMVFRISGFALRVR